MNVKNNNLRASDLLDPGRVYFVRCEQGGEIKIGFTKIEVGVRLSSMQSGCPYDLKVVGIIDPANRLLEAYLLMKFSPWTIRGEWFYPCSELIDFINSESREWSPRLAVRPCRIKKSVKTQTKKSSVPREA